MKNFLRKRTVFDFKVLLKLDDYHKLKVEEDGEYYFSFTKQDVITVKERTETEVIYFITVYKPEKNKNNAGYHLIHLGSKTYTLHGVVARSFVKNSDPETKVVINHKDGDKNNNRPNNLEWVTQSENMQHAISNGLINYNSWCHGWYTKKDYMYHHRDGQADFMSPKKYIEMRDEKGIYTKVSMRREYMKLQKQFEEDYPWALEKKD